MTMQEALKTFSDLTQLLDGMAEYAMSARISQAVQVLVSEPGQKTDSGEAADERVRV